MGCFAIVMLSLSSLHAQMPTSGQLPATDTVPLAGVAALPNGREGAAADSERSRQFSNVPDDVGYQLQESEQRIDAIFPSGPLSPLHDVWDEVNEHLQDSIRLDIGLNYTGLYQRADSVIRGRRDAAGGDLDFFGRWHLTGCENQWPGAIVFNSEMRHRMSGIAPADLNTGTLGGTIVSFDVQDFSLIQLYWEQGSFDDGLIVRIGEMDPSLIYDGGRYVSSNYAFLSPAFADTLPMPLPGASLGFAGAIYPTRDTYVAAGMHDANGRRTTAGFDTFFGEGEYFTAVEFGWFPNEGKENEGSYHFTLWNIDPRQNAGRRSDRGIALTMEQQVGPNGNVVPFLRYAYAHRGLNGIRQNLSLGLGFEELFGENFDIAGVAWSWAEPSNSSLRDQYTLEAFYRFMITPHTHLTPDVQVVLDPANAPNKNAVTVFGLRIRTLY